MRISTIRGVFGKSAEIYLKELIQGEQYAQRVRFVDAMQAPIDITGWTITVRYRKATAAINTAGSIPIISAVEWLRGADASGSLTIYNTKPETGVFYFGLPEDFYDTMLQWDNPLRVACALVEPEYTNSTAKPIAISRKHRVWLAIRPSLEHS